MFYIIVSLAAIFAMPAKADETLTFRVVQYIAASNCNKLVMLTATYKGFNALRGLLLSPTAARLIP
jgi:hypothetical protein